MTYFNRLLADIYNPFANVKIGGNQSQGVNGSDAISLLLQTFINLAFIIASIWTFFNLLRGGFEYITAGGDKESTQKARSRLTNALIGLFLIFSVYVILKLIETVLGINIINLTIPTLI